MLHVPKHPVETNNAITQQACLSFFLITQTRALNKLWLSMRRIYTIVNLKESMKHSSSHNSKNTLRELKPLIDTDTTYNSSIPFWYPTPNCLGLLKHISFPSVSRGIQYRYEQNRYIFRCLQCYHLLLTLILVIIANEVPAVAQWHNFLPWNLKVLGPNRASVYPIGKHLAKRFFAFKSYKDIA